MLCAILIIVSSALAMKLRITQNSATVIYNIFTNNIGELECGQSGTLVTDINDHFLIFHSGKMLE